MKFSKQYLNELSLKTNFIKDNIEKVLRLTEILKFINYESKYNELAFLRQFLGMQKRSDLYIHFVDKEHMGFMIYEICYSSLMNHILR